MNIGASGFNTHGLCDESLLQLEDRIKQQLPQNRRDDFPDSLSLWVQNGREKFFQCLFNTFVNETTLAHIYLFFQKDFSGLQIAILSHIIIQTINLFLWPIFRATAITVLYRSQYSRFLLFQRRDGRPLSWHAWFWCSSSTTTKTMLGWESAPLKVFVVNTGDNTDGYWITCELCKSVNTKKEKKYSV